MLKFQRPTSGSPLLLCTLYINPPTKIIQLRNTEIFPLGEANHILAQASFIPNQAPSRQAKSLDYEWVWTGSKKLGWNICVGDLKGMWVQVTTDGRDRSPDWVPSTKGSK